MRRPASFWAPMQKFCSAAPCGSPAPARCDPTFGGSLRTFSWNGLCFGVLICNDLWATPGSTTIANPYLAWKLKEMGAEMIFHPVSTGHVPRYRPYHESSQGLWAWSLGIPIVMTNAIHDETSPTNCRSGVVGTDGNRPCIAPDAGEQFFSFVVSI